MLAHGSQEEECTQVERFVLAFKGDQTGCTVAEAVCEGQQREAEDVWRFLGNGGFPCDTVLCSVGRIRETRGVGDAGLQRSLLHPDESGS